MTVKPLNSKGYTPAVVLQEVCAEADKIEDVAIAIRYKDGTYTTTTSCLSIERMSSLVSMYQHRLFRELDSAWEPE